jgi:hypothetical protein
MPSSDLPILGSLAWTPLPGADEIDIYDRFNGVPTLGILRTSQAPPHLFWRVIGYVTEFSFWLYVPLTPAEVERLAIAAEPDLLDGITHYAEQSRSASVAVALDNRLIFERGWLLPGRLGPADLQAAFLDHLIETLSAALEHDLPPSRREVYERAEAVAKRLAAA